MIIFQIKNFKIIKKIALDVPVVGKGYNFNLIRKWGKHIKVNPNMTIAWLFRNHLAYISLKDAKKALKLSIKGNIRFHKKNIKQLIKWEKGHTQEIEKLKKLLRK